MPARAIIDLSFDFDTAREVTESSSRDSSILAISDISLRWEVFSKAYIYVQSRSARDSVSLPDVPFEGNTVERGFGLLAILFPTPLRPSPPPPPTRRKPLFRGSKSTPNSGHDRVILAEEISGAMFENSKSSEIIVD